MITNDGEKGGNPPLDPPHLRWVSPEDYASTRRTLQAAVFGRMLDRACPVVKQWRSDLYHDAYMLDLMWSAWDLFNTLAAITGGTPSPTLTFTWILREYGGTYITPLDPAEYFRIGGHTKAYRVIVEITPHTYHGGWTATFIALDPKTGDAL